MNYVVFRTNVVLFVIAIIAVLFALGGGTDSGVQLIIIKKNLTSARGERGDKALSLYSQGGF